MTKLFVAVIIMLVLSGCASMISGTSDRITVNSNNPKTKIYLNEKEIGLGSTVAKVPKRGEYVFKGVIENCSDAYSEVERSFDPVSLLALLLAIPGWIGFFLVDVLITGAITKATDTMVFLSPICEKTLTN